MATLTGNFHIDVFLLIVSLMTIVIVYLRYKLTYWKCRGVYTPPPSLLFGNARNLILQNIFVGEEFKSLYLTLIEKGVKYGGYYFLTKPIFVPVDLDLIKRIMTQDFEHFTDHVFHINPELEPLTADLSSLKGQQWKIMRRKLTPAFTSARVKMMFQTIADYAEDLTVVIDDTLNKGESFDIKDIVARYVTDVIGSCAFGLECNSLRDSNSEFKKYCSKYFNVSLWESTIKLMYFLNPDILGYLNIRTLRKDVHDFFMRAVTQTVNFREKNNIIRHDIMHSLIEMKNNIDIDRETTANTGHSNQKAITIDELAAQCFIFFIAGFETSSSTSTFLLYELALNPSIQQKLREEINATITKYDSNFTYEATTGMVYMKKCIYETLRKYPPITTHTRECTKPYRIPNTNITLEKGSAVFIPVLGIQHDPQYFPFPEKFDPERFSQKGEAERHPFAWTPFGEGPRMCIGTKLGELLITVALIVLLKNYRFKLSSKTQLPLVIDPKMPFVLSVEGGIWLDAEKIV